MKNCFFILSVSLCILNSAVSQCVVDDTAPLDKVFIYPGPFGVFTPEEGGTGITDTAYLSEPFDISLTVVYPDTFINPVTNAIAYGDSMFFKLDETFFVLDGDTLDGLPAGLSIEGDPEGQFIANGDSPAGCIRIIGTPDNEVVPGDYLMTLKATICLKVPSADFDGCIDADIPSLFSGIPGEYRLIIADRTSSVRDVLNQSAGLSIEPNPMTEKALISFDASGLSGTYSLHLLDLSGKLVHMDEIEINQDRVEYELWNDHYASGVYILNMTGAEGQLTSKIIIE